MNTECSKWGLANAIRIASVVVYSSKLTVCECLMLLPH